MLPVVRAARKARPVREVARGARWLGGAGWLLGVGLLLLFPQRPAGDGAAVANFVALHGVNPLHTVGHALWWHGAGALWAWGALDALLRAASRAWRERSALAGGALLFWLGLLIFWTGWAWNQSRGWQGELFLEPGVPVALGVDRAPVVRFERFLLPPAPQGAGRALSMRLVVAGTAHHVTEARPYGAAGWTLTPRWYGATVRAPALRAPLFFGGDGTQLAQLRSGERVPVTVDVETLQVESVPPLRGATVTHHAIVRARFAPGEPLLRGGSGLAGVGGILWLWGRARPRSIW